MFRAPTPSRVARRTYRTVFASRGARANAAEALAEMVAANRRPLSRPDARRLATVGRGHR